MQLFSLFTIFDFILFSLKPQTSTIRFEGIMNEIRNSIPYLFNRTFLCFACFLWFRTNSWYVCKFALNGQKARLIQCNFILDKNLPILRETFVSFIFNNNHNTINDCANLYVQQCRKNVRNSHTLNEMQSKVDFKKEKENP